MASNRASFQDVPVFYNESLATDTPIRFTTPMAQTEVGRRRLQLVPSSASRTSASRSESGAAADTSSRHHPYVRVARSLSEATKAELHSGQDQGLEPQVKDLILKPFGEVGRPGRGGYNFDTALAWPERENKSLKNMVKAMVTTHLDPHKSFTAQDEAAVQSVITLVTQKFPRLQDYEECWPVADAIRMRLKYTRSRHNA